MQTKDYDVLVVGAGPAGLTTAISAARCGARVLVVERRASTSTLPRATHLSTRTMEIFRSWGLADAVRQRSIRVLPAVSRSRTLTDSDPTVDGLGLPPFTEVLRRSPTWPAWCPQDYVEPLLAGHLCDIGGQLSFGTELTGVAITGSEVRAELSGRRTVRARFFVGADGPRSSVRRALGIEVEELGEVGDWVMALVRADLARVVGKRRYFLYSIEHPQAQGVVVPAGNGRWLYAQQWYAERGEHPGNWTPQRIVERLRLAAGVPDLDVDVLRVQPFTMAGHIATTFRARCGFLVGDAAHRMTPVGGMGMNTAIHAGHNLGWKLAWVTRGWAGQALLDSYQTERRPIGLRNVLRSLRREEVTDPLAADLDVVYCPELILTAPEQHDAANPGERAPHAWVQLAGRRVSSLDLFDGQLTVLTGQRGWDWQRAVVRLAATGLPITAYTLGRDLRDPDGELADRYALHHNGAVLVRPDGYLAWRGEAADALPAVVAATLGRVDESLELAG
ncbi:MAG TPA: FAD-dependent monooxygenase [Pseudonocardiaceae bacterium]|nr:FAD-dependent monooxygenase [Pseudonocardiaceae bacterium]